MNAEWFTASEISRLTGWSIGYVRRLACLHRWRRLGTRPQLYHAHDIWPDLR